MKRVYKYVVNPDEPVRMPRGAELLHVGTQVDKNGEHVVVWALVSADAPVIVRRLRVFGTGHNLAGEATSRNYVGTAEFKTMPLVFHVFDLGEQPLGEQASESDGN